MTKLGWLFPGQASQYVGMGKDLYKNTDLAKSYFQMANDILGYNLKAIIFDGPEMVLKRTEHTQPAIFLISIILGELLKEKVGNPIVSAGHSLGEYSALTIANAFDFEKGMKLIKIRSEGMKKACYQKKGTMAAIIGFNDIKLKVSQKDILYRIQLEKIPSDIHKYRGKYGFFFEANDTELTNFENIIGERFQTVTYFGIEPNQIVNKTIESGLLGVDRVVPVGKALDIGVYWDGMDLVSSKFDDDTIASIPDDSNMTLGDLKKQIMDYESLASLMYPKQYESVESINVNLKEKYDRIFRSLK